MNRFNERLHGLEQRMNTLLGSAPAPPTPAATGDAGKQYVDSVTTKMSMEFVDRLGALDRTWKSIEERIAALETTVSQMSSVSSAMNIEQRLVDLELASAAPPPTPAPAPRMSEPSSKKKKVMSLD